VCGVRVKLIGLASLHEAACADGNGYGMAASRGTRRSDEEDMAEDPRAALPPFLTRGVSLGEAKLAKASFLPLSGRDSRNEAAPWLAPTMVTMQIHEDDAGILEQPGLSKAGSLSC
jgi:hypothetical protein